MTLIPILVILYIYITYKILSYSVFVMYVNNSSLISTAIFVGGLSSSDAEKKCLHNFLMFLFSNSLSSLCCGQ